MKFRIHLFLLTICFKLQICRSFLSPSSFKLETKRFSFQAAKGIFPPCLSHVSFGKFCSPPSDARSIVTMAEKNQEIIFVPGQAANALPRRGSGSHWDEWFSAKEQTVENHSKPEWQSAHVEQRKDDDNLRRLLTSTMNSLDWKVLKDALVSCGQTSMGRESLQSLVPLPSAEDVVVAHNAIEEVRRLREQGVALPIGQVADIREATSRAAKGDVLDLEELYQASGTLEALREVEGLLEGQAEAAPTLHDIGQDIHIDAPAALALSRSFDMTGQLSIQAYPKLDLLRKEIDRIQASVTQTMDEMVRSPEFSGSLQDKFYTIRDNRFVLPVSAGSKTKVQGIVHGTSGTGSTIYIEPQQVIDLNNRLRLAEGELKAEETRIRTDLSQRLGSQNRNVVLGVGAVAALDVAHAREAFAESLSATRPRVEEGGKVDMRGARHPVLVLRGVRPVPNDVALDRDRPALVISGPNAGGKTVVLKTVGLCAMLVQHGCFITAESDSQVDLFDRVFAAIGDQQTVQEDLSSFSSHLLTLSTMMAHAGSRTLLLLDEIASGTDPAQGSAIAQAVLEELLQAGPRLLVTTHFSQLKALATVDPRFSVAAMQYQGDRPTYKVLHGVTGESHALSIARRMGIAEPILQRAEDLMGAQAKMTKTLEALESERARAQIAADQAEATRQQLERSLQEVAQREENLRARSRQLEKQGAEDFLRRLSDAEVAIGQVVKDLQQNPNFKQVDAARSILADVRGQLLKEAGLANETGSGPKMLRQGDRVLLLDIGGEGEVSAEPGPRGDLQVKVGSFTLRTTIDRCRLVAAAPATPSPSSSRRSGGGGAGGKGASDRGKATQTLQQAVRTQSNTLDLRGKRAEEVADAVDQFLDNIVRTGRSAAFILTGHGTGVLKKVVKEHLTGNHYVAAFGPADFEQGGDALTVVALK